MNRAIGFDIYGTLVDPLEMNERLRPLVGEKADRASELWRQKQLEYTFRRGLMKSYKDFGVCTAEALEFTDEDLELGLSDGEKSALVSAYQDLQAFPDVASALQEMKSRGHRLAAFSNGVEATARTLLENAGVLAHLDEIVSVHDLETFKPDPAVYEYLAQRFERPAEEVWLVSSNPFDVVGARSVGMKATWVRRKSNATFDPWGIEPNLTVSDLEHLATELG